MRGVALLAATAMAVLCLGLLRAPVPAGADAILLDPGFEAFEDGSWTVEGAAAESVENPGSGVALRLTLAGADARLFQTIDGAQPGAGYEASVEVWGDAVVTAALRLEFFDSDWAELGAFAQGATASLGAGPQTLSVSHPSAPPGTAGLRLSIVLQGAADLTATLDNATLQETAPEPTPTPEPTSTPTPAPPTSTPTTGPSPTPTRTPTPTKTPTPPNEPTGTRTPAPTGTPTPTRTPTPPKQATPTRTPTMPPTSTPTARPGTNGFGGLLANGDFEQVSGGKPVGWAKFGGEMTSTADAARGAHAACLQSDTSSTKWLHQAVPVEGGAWYAASVEARVSGPAAVSLRVSWYASTDGSGSSIGQHDSPEATAPAWTGLATGPIQAPEAARSARIRLMLWPAGNSAACFDDAYFAAANASPPTPTTPPATNVRPPSPVVTRAVPTAHTPGQPAPTTPAPTGPAVIIAGRATPGPITLRFSEILGDPPEPGRDAPYEWVELVNTGTAPIDLGGWSIEDASGRDELPAATVPPGGYVVVRGHSAVLPAGVLAVSPADGEIGNGLGNTGDRIRLVAPNGTVVDEMSYGDNTSIFDPAPQAPAAGRTIGLLDPLADPGGDSWALTSIDTPGAPNVFPPRAQATATLALTATPNASDPDKPAVTLNEAPDGGGSVAPWMILGGILGIGAGMAGAAFAPRIRRSIEAQRAR
jgi:hypothetical protein